MRRYKFQHISFFLWIFTITFICICGALLLSQLPFSNNSLLFIVLILPIVYLSFYLTKYTSYSDIQLGMGEDGIEIKYLKQPFFLNRINAQIYWEDIEAYKYEPSLRYDKFVIKLKTGKRIKFFHETDKNGKDNFLKLITDFSFTVNRLNNEKFNDGEIKTLKVIYETTYGLVSAIIVVLFLIAAPVLLLLLLIFKGKSSTNFAGLILSYIGGFYYVYEVYSHRKKKKK
jgi:hypothetical protein